MKTTEQIIDQRVAEFKAQLLKELTPKVEFEENIWWVTTLGSVYFINKIDGNRCDGFGISGGDWFNQGSHCAKDQLSHPASESEIKEALTKQIEKLGFTKGVEYKSMITAFTYNYKGNLKYIADDDKLVDNGECSIYHQGKFATIVKEEAIKIGEFKAEWINSGTILKVGCQEFCKQHVFDLKHSMETFKINEVLIQNKTITIGTVNAILEKLK